MNFLEFLSAYSAIGDAFYTYWWIVFPVAFYFFFKLLWMDFRIFLSADSWVKSLEWTLLEIIPPKDIEKSPKVMESIYAGIAGVVVGFTPFDLYLEGKFTDRFSLELVGNEGEVHFYIRTQKKLRNLIEAQIYAQFPDSEITEVEDYVDKFPKTVPNKNWDLWGTDIELAMPDPYPIKTYDKFEEDITGTMIDPLAAMAEVIGRLGPGQNIWLQIIVEPLKEIWRQDEMELVDELAKKAGTKEKNILDHLADVFSNLIKGFSQVVEFEKDEKKDDQPVEFKLTPGEKEVLKAVEENLGRNAFKTKMRLIYLGRQEVFDKSFVSAFFGSLKQFNDLNLNNLKPQDDSKTYANYFFKKDRLAYRQRRIYKRYKDRSMDGLTFVFTTKELATIYHFPDMGVKAPSITTLGSKRGSAPSNLPV